MSAIRNIRKKWLAGLGVSCLALLVALTHEPAVAGTSDAVNDGAFWASINVPLDDILEGQWCVAYANVYNYTGPLEYLWGGDYFSGTTQAVGAYMWGDAGWVTLRVIDKGVTPHDTITADAVQLQVRSDPPYNIDCEG